MERLGWARSGKTPDRNFLLLRTHRTPRTCLTLRQLLRQLLRQRRRLLRRLLRRIHSHVNRLSPLIGVPGISVLLAEPSSAATRPSAGVCYASCTYAGFMLAQLL